MTTAQVEAKAKGKAKAAPGRHPEPSASNRAKAHERTLVKWLEGHPTITAQADAEAAGFLIVSTRVALRELREQRNEETQPLKNQIEPLKAKLDAINVRFKQIRFGIEKLDSTMKERLAVFALAEEQKTGAPISVEIEPVAGARQRTIALKSREVLTVTDACAAINAMGMSRGIELAICEAAEQYREDRGVLPPGVTISEKRGLA